MSHLVLLGDSVFDNRAYVPKGPPVIDQVTRALPRGWSATLRAVDGHTTREVPSQLRTLPAGASHLAVSAGGNDALGVAHLLGAEAATVGGAAAQLDALAGAFERSYRAMLGAVLARGLPTAVCTIYRPRFADAAQQAAAVGGLAHFNDAILRVAFEHRLPVVDLRLVMSSPDDYANDIEPGVPGGGKIARALVEVATRHDWARPRSAVYTG
jgi:hypothetical protein